MCCIMEQPDRGDAFCGSQVLQVHQKCDRVKAQEVLSQRSESPEILHQLRTQASVCEKPSAWKEQCHRYSITWKA